MASWWLVWAVGSVATAAEPAWGDLRASAGWATVSTKKSELGDVEVAHKLINDLPCLRGTATVTATPAELLSVAKDVKSSVDWTSADLTASDVLGKTDGAVDFYQYLDVPDWTLVADRYWVLRGTWSHTSGAELGFRWERIDRTSRYAEVHERVLAQNSRAVEPPINWGEWVFVPHGTGAKVHYYACADIGGSIPSGIQKLVATHTLPSTVEDLVREALRRRGA